MKLFKKMYNVLRYHNVILSILSIMLVLSVNNVFGQDCTELSKESYVKAYVGKWTSDQKKIDDGYKAHSSEVKVLNKIKKTMLKKIPQYNSSSYLCYARNLSQEFQNPNQPIFKALLKDMKNNNIIMNTTTDYMTKENDNDTSLGKIRDIKNDNAKALKKNYDQGIANCNEYSYLAGVTARYIGSIGYEGNTNMFESHVWGISWETYKGKNYGDHIFIVLNGAQSKVQYFLDVWANKCITNETGWTFSEHYVKIFKANYDIDGSYLQESTLGAYDQKLLKNFNDLYTQLIQDKKFTDSLEDMYYNY